jgi:FkbM family methyltransferase
VQTSRTDVDVPAATAMPLGRRIRHAVIGALNVHRFAATARNFYNWPQFYMMLWGPRRTPFIARMRNGMRFWVRNETDWEAIAETIIIQWYGDLSFLGGDSVVVDVGAHIGTFSVLAAGHCGRVVAFEPNPDTYKTLLGNLELNGVGNVVAVSMGVAGVGGQRDFFEPGGDGISALADGIGEPTGSLECMSLTQACAQYGLARIDLLKLDCEGAEFEILRATPLEVLQRVSGSPWRFTITARGTPCRRCASF